jgi:tetratricopeptide (TPR) repeat protein
MAATKVWEILGNHEKVARALEKATALDPQNADLWHIQGLRLVVAKRLEEAEAALSKAVEVAAKDDPCSEKGWRQALLDRAQVRRHLSRTNEAQADWLLAM